MIIRIVVICFICRGRHLFLGDHNVTSLIFGSFLDHVCWGCDGCCKASVSWLCGMYGVDVWLEQVKCRFGPEMK